jgi:hypothetical protein
VRPSTTSILVALLAATSAPLLSQANTWESGIVKISARNGDSPATGFVVALRNNVAWIITSAHVREFIHSEAGHLRWPGASLEGGYAVLVSGCAIADQSEELASCSVC